MAEDYVNFLALHAIPKAMMIAKVQEETKADSTLQRLMEVIRSGKWNDLGAPQPSDVDASQMRQLFNVKHALAVNGDHNLILCGSRIVVPTSLQRRAINIAHEGHQDIVKTKRLV